MFTFFSKRSPKASQHRPSFQPRIEALEERALLAYSVANGTLTIGLDASLGQQSAALSQVSQNGVDYWRIDYTPSGGVDLVPSARVTSHTLKLWNTDPNAGDNVSKDVAAIYWFYSTQQVSAPTPTPPAPTPPATPPAQHGPGKAISVGTEAAAGRDEVWLEATNGELYRYSNGAWADIGNTLDNIQAGKGEVFGIEGGTFWCYNDRSGWSKGYSANGGFTALSVGTDGSGGDEVWLQDKLGYTWRYDRGQMSPSALIRNFTRIQAGHGEVFALSASGDLYAFNDTSLGLARLTRGISFKGMSVGRDLQGYDEVWLQGSTDGWTYLYHQNTLKPYVHNLPTIRAGAHGQVYGINPNDAGKVYSCTDRGLLTNLNGTGFNSLSVGTDLTGRGDEVWLQGNDGSTWRYNGAWQRMGYGVSNVQAGHGEAFGLDGNGNVTVFWGNALSTSL
jgi:hypothetical protein